MKKLKCIKELDALYDFRQWLESRIEINVFRAYKIENTIEILQEYIDDIYPSIKKEK